MNLDEAIERLNSIVKAGFYFKTTPDKAAIQLGIEALKREEEHRQRIAPKHIWLLPGETKE